MSASASGNNFEHTAQNVVNDLCCEADLVLLLYYIEKTLETMEIVYGVNAWIELPPIPVCADSAC